MDDLLIVRSSDRVRPHLRHRREASPIGANFGIILGAACGIIGASQTPHSPTIGLALGLAVGIAIGGLIGPLLRSRFNRISRYPRNHYDGMPFSEPGEEQEDNEKRLETS
ncbi:hypothetical protein [Pelagicoccus albus]|uniref:Glycine zipper domain-containing protein n=1 Tax=Pelagicoccus albus TaxID=415222 RepID=A0A7X1B9D9_9BACT|nr:hypothetical protein [Pelagicoccus albus]MBC2606823.1 hypothetical protein [Pelagicoccus albus]